MGGLTLEPPLVAVGRRTTPAGVRLGRGLELRPHLYEPRLLMIMQFLPRGLGPPERVELDLKLLHASPQTQLALASLTLKLCASPRH